MIPSKRGPRLNLSHYPWLKCQNYDYRASFIFIHINQRPDPWSYFEQQFQLYSIQKHFTKPSNTPNTTPSTTLNTTSPSSTAPIKTSATLKFSAWIENLIGYYIQYYTMNYTDTVEFRKLALIHFFFQISNFDFFETQFIIVTIPP